MARILVADDEEGFRSYVAHVLTKEGHAVTEAHDGLAALEATEQHSFDLVVTDLAMPRMHGIDLIRHLRERQPEIEVIVWTSHGSIEAAVEAVKLGAFDFLEKPPQSPEQFTVLTERALERRRLRARDEQVSRETTEDKEMPLSYGDPSMEPVVRAVGKVAPTDATVLLLGESGTGKEVAARAIHGQSLRSAGPFVVVNCAALPENLIESELFGHERGAFTGATERRRGRIELAQGGTFFLDEIGELRTDTQAKLLRVLQDGVFEHLGGHQQIHADVRWIAATNRDLDAMMADGLFREDLYHRLALFPIRLPPLRERPADIVPIAETILRNLSRRTGRRRSLHPAARNALVRHPWRGNVRELANTIERACILADDVEIGVDDLALDMGGRQNEPRAELAAAERDVLEAALRECGGSRREAAKRLGIGERTLYTKIKRFGLS